MIYSHQIAFNKHRGSSKDAGYEKNSIQMEKLANLYDYR